MTNKEKIRVNITVDKETLSKARKKLYLFGGKLSTLFNRYLEEFVKSSEEGFGEGSLKLNDKLDDIEKRLRTIEGKR